LAEVGAVGDKPATREGARAFRTGLEELGTTFIKLGQMLSSRPDLLPDVYVEELEQLVDDVPPFPFDEARRIVDEEVGLEIFARLDEQPLACASIAQIHGGLLRTGREVVVKVRRPLIEEEVALDLELLRSLTSFAEGRSQTARLLQLAALADELEAHLTAELDFVEEAHGSELIARIVGDDEHLVVPAVIRPYVTQKVLVQERIVGVRVIRDHGLDPERAAVLAHELFGASCNRSPCTACTTPTPTAATSCSPRTAGSRCSTSACWAVSTTTRGGRSACSCSRSRRTAQTTSPISSSASR
jgi:predicted unusual protein kinase regulating ubiquinone biosynthesis (AarF/ABC1/UbiB family)